MAVILGLDVASTTGFAWYDTGASLSAIKTGLIKSTGDNAEEKAASLALQLVAMLKAEKPDFVAIEEPLRNVKMFKKKGKPDLAGNRQDEDTINPNALMLEGLVCSAVAIVAAFRVPWATVSAQTWRKAFLCMGRSPGFDRAAWKRAAVERCRAFRIDVKNADAAEAVGIAFAGAGCQAFKHLQSKVAA